MSDPNSRPCRYSLFGQIVTAGPNTNSDHVTSLSAYAAAKLLYRVSEVTLINLIRKSLLSILT